MIYLSYNNIEKTDGVCHPFSRRDHRIQSKGKQGENMAKMKKQVRTKSENKQAIYRYILNKGNVTRQDIFIDLGLSLPTIKQAIEFLMENDLIEEGGVLGNTGGRNAATYCIADSSRYAIGVYISYHHLTAVSVDLRGNILNNKRIYCPLDLQSESYLKMIGELVESIRTSAEPDNRELLGVGIAVPSLISEDGDSIIYGFSGDFTGITSKVFERYIPYPCRLFHDSTCAGYTEFWNSGEIKNAVYLNLNNTVGSSLFIDGSPYTGDNRLAGELGHMIMNPKSDQKCYCGRYGCLNTVCNAGILDSLTDGDLDSFFRLLDEKDEKASGIWDEYLDYLALAVHNLRMMLDCTVIIGGYVGSNIEPYMHILNEKIDNLSVFTPKSVTYTVPCRFKKESTAAGAALQILDRYISSL